MARHGVGSRFGSSFDPAGRSPAAVSNGPAASASPPAAPARRPGTGHEGFSHFAGEPTNGARWKLRGKTFDPADTEQHDRASQLLEMIAAREEQEHDSEQDLPAENPNLPAGYTYLLQLLAHDLAHSSVSPAIIGQGPVRVLNLRTEWLQLETIYAGGPDDEPNAYADRSPATLAPMNPSDSGVGAVRPWLRLGRMRGQNVARERCPFLDIPRATNEDMGTASIPLVCDPRNDHNPIVAQMMVLFAHLHNAIVDRAIAAGGGAAGNDEERAHRLYTLARKATTLVYRRIVRNDLLRRLLEPRIHAAYEGGLEPLHRRPGDDEPLRLPIEFTHAALRAGHALVRFNYKFRGPQLKRTREVLLTNSSLQPARVPLEREWIVDWKDFFEIDPARPVANLALRLRPRNHPALQEMPGETALIDPGLAHSRWLSFRDNLSCIEGRPWSLAALRRIIAGSAAHRPFLAASRLLESDGIWVAPIMNWINARPLDGGGFAANDALWLAQDPPLPLYILLEAKLENPALEGERLGTLGSILFADVVYRIIRDQPVVANEIGGSLADHLRTLAADGGVPLPDAGRLAQIGTMPDLIAWLAPNLPAPV